MDYTYRSDIVRTMQGNLTRARQKHSFGVAGLARKLCIRYEINPQKGILAGLAHDIAREMKDADILNTVAPAGKPLTALELERPVLLHGRAAAMILNQEFGLEDSELLLAVEDHVVGRPGMGLLSKIVFSSDFLEPTRAFISGKVRNHILALKGYCRICPGYV